jgi:hypothetical protein
MSSYRVGCRRCHCSCDPFPRDSDEVVKIKAELRNRTLEEFVKNAAHWFLCDTCTKLYEEAYIPRLLIFESELFNEFICCSPKDN